MDDGTLHDDSEIVIGRCRAISDTNDTVDDYTLDSMRDGSNGWNPSEDYLDALSVFIVMHSLISSFPQVSHVTLACSVSARI